MWKQHSMYRNMVLSGRTRMQLPKCNIHVPECKRDQLHCFTNDDNYIPDNQFILEHQFIAQFVFLLLFTLPIKLV